MRDLEITTSTKFSRLLSDIPILKILFSLGLTILVLIGQKSFALENQLPKNFQQSDPCSNTKFYYKVILDEIAKKNLDAFNDLPKCFKNDQQLIIKAILINYQVFSLIDEDLQKDPNFIKRLVKVNPMILKLSPPELTKDHNFMEEMTYIHRDALQYASWSLLDNRQFMTKMIEFDSQNYKYASDRIRSIEEIALIALRDNGLILKYAPYSLKNDYKIVEKALESDINSFEFASKKLRNNEDLKKLTEEQILKIDLEKLDQFIKRNYFTKNPQRNLEDLITNQGKFYGKRQIFNRNYLTKWQKKLGDVDPVFHNYQEEFKMIAVDTRNYQTNFKEDLKPFPQLINKITKFLKKHRVDENTIDNLKITYLWKISEKPLTFAMNLYFLRDSSDLDLGSDFANISSLTIIVSDISKTKNIKEDNIKLENSKSSDYLNKTTKTNNNSLDSKKNKNKHSIEGNNKINQEDNFASEENYDLEQDQDSETSDLGDTDRKLIFDEDIQIDELNPKEEEDDPDSKIKKNKKKKADKNKKTINKKLSGKSNDEEIKKTKSKIIILEDKNTRWNLSVIEAVFDSETRIDPTFKNGHKRYVLWDLYKIKKDDTNPKLIYRVEDQVQDYFVVFARQKNHKYQQIYSTQKLDQ
ncbi:hypothetical protein LBMAG18_05570 [Alphaproteobacteria bacterium]|nr:hypothetical protein LBMAG18_05570 [Alphaproteobacteria bacterium]